MKKKIKKKAKKKKQNNFSLKDETGFKQGEKETLNLID